MANLMEIERLASELPEDQRARLVVHILESLPALFYDEDEGMSEAMRRDKEMDENNDTGVDEVKFHQMVEARRSL